MLKTLLLSSTRIGLMPERSRGFTPTEIQNIINTYGHSTKRAGPHQGILYHA